MAAKKAANSALMTERNCDAMKETNLDDWWAICSQKETWKARKFIDMLRNGICSEKKSWDVLEKKERPTSTDEW